MKENENVRVVLRAFDAVERQDDLQFHTLSALGDEIPDNFSY
jgi:hypothetical protein